MSEIVRDFLTCHTCEAIAILIFALLLFVLLLMAQRFGNLPDNMETILYVKRGQGFGGYKLDYLNQNLSEIERDFLICEICGAIARDACIANERVGCSSCRKNSMPDKRTRTSVVKLKIKCPLLRDCEWIGRLKEAQTHLNTCYKFRIPCTLKCEKVMQRSEMENHTKNDCPLRKVQCQYCLEYFFAKDLQDHLKVCPEHLIKCRCDEDLLRKHLTKHIQTECPLAVVKCPYAKYSCRIGNMLRKDLLAHKQEFYIEHQDMLEEESKRMKEESKRMKEENKRMEEENKKLKEALKTKKELNGIELVINGEGELISDSGFTIGSYAFKCYLCSVRPIKLKIERLPMRAVSGNAYNIVCLTECRIIVDPTKEKQEPYFELIKLNFKLSQGDAHKFFEMKHEVYSEYFQADGNLKMKLYFDLDYVTYKGYLS